MPKPSQAEAFYRKIVRTKARAFAYLQELSDPAEETDENEWREFKSAGFIDAPLATGDDAQKERRRRDALVKKYWSENLGAFANSGGGVLIWGIKAPAKFAAGTDLAKDASKLADRLQELASQAVDPPVSGVEVRAILRPRGAGDGFVVCYVPQSEFSPHRAIWADREYYLRFQDGNHSMSAAVLRQMFYPRVAPLIVPVVYARMQPSGAGAHLEVQVDLRNRGLGSAENVMVHFRAFVGQLCATYPSDMWTREIDTQNFRFSAAIHPEQTVRLFNNCAANFPAWPLEDETLRFSFRAFARNVSPVWSEVSFTGSELHLAAVNCRRIEREGVIVEASG